MAQADLEVINLTKRYGAFLAVNAVSFSIPKGKIIGLLGPNGAGKTTTIQMLTGVTLPTAGEIRYFGMDFHRYAQACLQRINFTSSYNTLQGRISVWENLMVFAQLYNVDNPKTKITELLDYFEIPQLKTVRFWDLSAGQKTRVNLVKSLLNDPELILMDEPTASLDPDIADKTLSLIEDLNKSRYLSILYTSHNMDEVTRICDEVIFLDKGNIFAHDTPLGLTKRITASQLQLTFDGNKAAYETYLKQKGYKYSFLEDLIVRIDTEEKDIPAVIFAMQHAGVTITDIDINKPKLEDVFLQIARGQHHES